MAPAETRVANVFRQEAMELSTPLITSDGKADRDQKAGLG